MDPNFFHLDYDRLVEVLFTIVVLSFFIERALAVVFETKLFINFYDAEEKRKGTKELIALVVSIAVCVYWKFDALSIIIVSHSDMNVPGYFLTGAIIAGGSKASLKLFRDVMKIRSSAEEERKNGKGKNGNNGGPKPPKNNKKKGGK